MQTGVTASARAYRVVQKVWHNGVLRDELLICEKPTFEQATEAARRLTGDRVRLNNDDVTVSIEPVDNGVRRSA